MGVLKHKPKWSQRPITSKGQIRRSQWELKVKTSELTEARENAVNQETIEFCFASDWLIKWRKISGLIIEWIKANLKQSRITFDANEFFLFRRKFICQLWMIFFVEKLFPCEDYKPYCKNYAQTGQCRDVYTQRYCRKSCDLCKGEKKAKKLIIQAENRALKIW